MWWLHLGTMYVEWSCVLPSRLDATSGALVPATMTSGSVSKSAAISRCAGRTACSTSKSACVAGQASRQPAETAMPRLRDEKAHTRRE